MNPLKTIALIAALAAMPGTVSAQSVQDQIVRQLRDQGFTEMRVSRTLLGRTRIVALRGDVRREIVFNPVTGEILRDWWREEDDDGDDDEDGRILSPGGGGGSSGGRPPRGGGDDDEDDDEDDDDDDDDEDDD